MDNEKRENFFPFTEETDEKASTGFPFADDDDEPVEGAITGGAGEETDIVFSAERDEADAPAAFPDTRAYAIGESAAGESSVETAPAAETAGHAPDPADGQEPATEEPSGDSGAEEAKIPAEDEADADADEEEPDADADEDAGEEVYDTADSAEENGRPDAEKPKKNSISSDLIRGHINTIILRTLYEGDRYGYDIISEIEKKSHGQYTLKQPTLYSALKRLESQGYVKSYWGGVSNGGRRRYFSLTESGRAIAEQNQAEWEYSRTIIDSLISENDFDFSNPPPEKLDFRILRQATSRTPIVEEEFAEPYSVLISDARESRPIAAETTASAETTETAEPAEAESGAPITGSAAETEPTAEPKAETENETETTAEPVAEAEKTEAEDAAAFAVATPDASAAAADEAVISAENAETPTAEAAENGAVPEETETAVPTGSDAAADFILPRPMPPGYSAHSENISVETQSGPTAAEEIPVVPPPFEQTEYPAPPEPPAPVQGEPRAEDAPILPQRMPLGFAVPPAPEAAQNGPVAAEEAPAQPYLAPQDPGYTVPQPPVGPTQNESVPQNVYTGSAYPAGNLYSMPARPPQPMQAQPLPQAQPQNAASNLYGGSERSADTPEEYRGQADKRSIPPLYISRTDEERNYKEIVSRIYRAGFKKHETPSFRETPPPPQAEAETATVGEEYRMNGPAQAENYARSEEPAVKYNEAAYEPTRPLTPGRIDFQDIEEQARYDGLRVWTAGGAAQKREMPEDFFNKGLALLRASLLFFAVAIVETVIAAVFRGQLGLGVGYLVTMLVCALLPPAVCAVLYFAKFQPCCRRLKNNSSIYNGIVAFLAAFILLVAIDLIADVNLTDAVTVVKFIVIPFVYLLNIIVFAVAYYFLSRSKV